MLNLKPVSRVTLGLFRVFVMLSISGCASFDAAKKCQDDAGPQPNAWMNLFGAVGALANAAQPETQAYHKKIDDCMAKWKAEQQKKENGSDKPSATNDDDSSNAQ